MRPIIFGTMLVLGASGAVRGQTVSHPSKALKPPAPLQGSVPEKIAHMIQAAEHLEAAGLEKQAEAVRKRAQKERKAREQKRLAKRLAGKLAQLQELQKEIDELRRRTGKVQQVEIEVQVLELDLQKLRASGFNMDGFDARRLASVGLAGVLQAHSGQSPGQSSPPVALVQDEKKLLSLVKLLKSEELLKTLAEPTVVTTNGRPAVYQSGGEFPVVVPAAGSENTIQWREFGVRLEVVPEMETGGKVRLEISCQLVERDMKNAVRTVGGLVPGLTTSRVNTQVEMKLGRTVILGGMRSKSADDDGRTAETERTVLVTPKQVEHPRKSPPMR